MQFELISKHHVKQLLCFELENRSWFESVIEPRDNAFYSELGVSSHIDSEIEKVNSGSAFCALLIKDNKIVARANLRDVCADKAFVGYRVSKNFISQGYASFCLASLIKIAKTEFGIKTLEALSKYSQKVAELDQLEDIAHRAGVMAGPKRRGRKPIGLIYLAE